MNTVPAHADLASLQRENAALKARLQEAEDTLHALRCGEVDAIMVGEHVYTLEGSEAAANRFRSDVLAQMDDAVLVLDASGHVIYLNPAAERQYGVAPSWALGRPRASLYTEEWPDAADEDAAQRAMQDPGYWRGRNLHRRADGSALLVECAHSALRDERGAVTGKLVVARDVSARAAAEAALHESRARLHFALESARIGDWELDLDTGSTRRSLRHDQCFGYDAPVPDWNFEVCLQHVHVDDRIAVHQAVARAADGGGDAHFECRVVWPDATEHWIEVHATLAVGGTPVRRLVGIVCDITERKRAEAALREADGRKDVFLATLAHELRNPLAPIRNAVRILQLTAEPQARERALATLERQLEHLVRLLDDLMDVSRISRGKMELRRAPVAVAAVLLNAVDSTRPLFEQRRHELVLNLPPQPVVLDADPTRLTQVVVNLLDNAAKYTPDCGLITLSAQPQGDTLLISVQDNGIGIHPAMLPRVFDMFTQVKRRTGAATEGMGIGLALVQRLVELHGGSVRALSEGEARGTTMELRLPLQVATAAAPALAAPAAPGLPPTSRRVLVAEDNPDSASSMVMLLQLMGHQTAVAHDGLQAVASAREFLPQVVLMDIGLPGCDGYEAARRIRAQDWGRDMLLVALTGWGQDTDRERSRQAGINHHLLKPVDPKRLEVLLRLPLPD